MKVSKKTYRGIRLAVFALALALVVTAVPLGILNSAPTAKAVNVSNWNDLKSQIQSVGNGSSLTVTIPSGTTINSGNITDKITVNNGANITVINNGTLNSDNKPSWSFVDAGVFIVGNNATLTISGSGAYNLRYDYGNNTVQSQKHQFITYRMAFIKNNGGTVNIQDGNITVYSKSEWNDISGVTKYGAGHTFVWSAIVWNTTASCVTNITGGNLSLSTFSKGVASKDNWANYNLASGETGGVRLFQYNYGVIGGKINMNGGSISLWASNYLKKIGSVSSCGAVAGCTSFGLFSDNIVMTNGEISATNNYGDEGMPAQYSLTGAISSWAAGVAYQHTSPVIDGGKITTDITNFNAWNAGDVNTAFAATMGTSIAASLRARAVLHASSQSCVNYDLSNYDKMAQKNSNGTLSDGQYGNKKAYPLSSIGIEHRWREDDHSAASTKNSEYISACGNYAGVPGDGVSTDSNGRTTTFTEKTMNKGQNGNAGGAKNMYVYRYFRADGSLWKYQYSPDAAINGTNGHVHFICDTPVTTTTGAVYYDDTKNPGARPNNPYKWELTDIAYTTRTFGDTDNINLDALFKTAVSSMEVTDTFSYTGANHTFTVHNQKRISSRSAGCYVYVFLDYTEKNPEELSLTYTANLKIPYDGSVITTADCGIQIWGTRNTAATTDDDDITSIANATYSYSGTSPSGKALSGNGLPKDAGVYTISYNVPENNETNRKALTGTFPVEIIKTNPEFSDVAASITYTDTLGSINLSDIINCPVRNLINDFDYTWALGSDYAPNVAETGAFYVTCTPKEAVKDNYSAASYSFVVNVTVNAKEVSLGFNSASVEYGEELDLLANITFADANGNITDGALKQEILDTAKNDIKILGGNIALFYTPGVTTAGEYTWGLDNNSIIKGNFNITLLSNGVLTVTKAPLSVTVKAAEPSFAYVEGKNGEIVTFALSDVEGIKDKYDSYGSSIAIDSAFVQYPNHGNAGTGELYVNIDDLTLSGTKADCYYIANTTLTQVEITKAQVPSSIYEIPSIPEITYDPMQSLLDILAAYDFTDTKGGGSFSPKDGDIVPSVDVGSYTFIYTPSDSANYENTEVQIPITITKRVITVSAAPFTAEYGSEVPDSSEYEWTFSGWTDDAAAKTDGTDFPVLQSVNGKIVKAGETSDNSLGMAGTWESATLTSGYTQSTNAGTPVYINVNGTFDMSASNYEFQFESGSFSVTKRILDVTAPNAEAVYGVIPTADASLVEYGSDEHGFANDDTAESVFGSSNPVSFIYGSGIYGEPGFIEYVPGAHDAGEYNIFVVFANENLTNYELVKTAGTLTVTKRVVTLVPADTTLTFGDEIPAEFAYTATDGSIDLAEVFSGIINTATNYSKGSNAGGSYYIAPVCNDDGSYSAEQQPDLAVDNNYTIVFGDNGVLTVEKADIPVSEVQYYVPDINITYSDSVNLNDQLKALGYNEAVFTYNDIAVTGEFSYDKGASYPHVSESGAFDMIFTPTGSSETNYNIITGLTSNVNIEKAEVKGNLLIGGQLMVGGMIYPSTSGLIPSGIDNYTFEWYFVEDNGYETFICEGNRYLLDAADEGKIVKLVAVLDEEINGDYRGSVDYTSTSKVSPPLDTIEAAWIVADYESPVTYDGKPHSAVAAVTNLPADRPAYTGTVIVKYNGEETAPVDAGTYYITVDCSGDSNYAATSAVHVGTLIIQPSEIVLGFSVQNKVYDSTTKADFPLDADGNPDKSSIVIVSGLVEADADSISLNVNNAKAEFENAQAGENVAVELFNVYLTGDRAANYVLSDSITYANIEKAKVTATAKLKTYAVNYSPDLVNEETSGVWVYFSNISGIMARDKSSFRIAEDSVAVIDPAGGKNCDIDMSTISAIPNNSNYYVEVTNTDVIQILVNKINPETAAVLAPELLTMDSRVYDSKGNLTNEELRAFIATLDGGKYAADAKYYSWVVTDGATPIPQVSTSSTPRSYYVVFDNNNENYKPVTFRVRVPVAKREVVVQGASFSIQYGADSPLNNAEAPYTVISGLYADETLASVFKAQPTVRTSYIKYANIGNYPVTVNAANLRNNNYTVTVKEGNIAVNKVNITAQAAAASKTYDGKRNNIVVSFSELSGKVRPNDDVYLPAYVYGTTADANAGNNKLVTITVPALEGSAAGNYNLIIINASRILVNVEKLTPSDYRFPDTASINFGEMLSAAELDGTELGDGTFRYELATEVPAAVGIYQNTYDMVFTPSDSNYDSVKKKVTLEVNVAHLNVTPVITGSIYIGNTVTANLSGVPGGALNYIHYKWYRVDPSTGAQSEVGNDSATYNLTSADVGYNIKVVCSFNADDPYQGSGEAVSATVKEESLSFWQKIWKWWYQLLAAIQRIFTR